MSKEIARFQLTSGANNLERWVIPDNVNVITENTDSTHYSETYQHKFYNSAIINFDTSLYGYLWASSMLLFDASCQVTIERSTNGGSTWSNYRTTNFQTLRNSFYTSRGGDSGIGGTYWINLNSNDAQCISSVLPIYDNATDFNNAVTNVYVPEKASGGAGSGYIGNSLLSNKKMVGYNVPTSSAESTKTESVDEASESPVSGKPKIGNGYAKIKLLREYPTPPSNYLVDIEAEYGAFNLVTQYPLDRSYLTGVAVQNDYFYREDLIGSTVQSGFFIPYGNKLNITGKFVFETEVLIGDEDRTATASPDFTMGFYSGFSYSTRIIEMTYRNHNFQSTSAWDYFYYYSNCPLGYPKAPMDYEEYYNRFTKIKFELVLESGVLKKLICYRDNVLYQEDNLNIDVSSIDVPYIKLSIPSANNKQPLTQKIKYFKVYTET